MQFIEILKRIVYFSDQPETFWSTALAGEAGEFCNLVKKHVRDNIPDDEIEGKLAEELADVFIYTVLNARFHNIDLEQAILDKLDILEKRWKNDKIL